MRSLAKVETLDALIPLGRGATALEESPGSPRTLGREDANTAALWLPRCQPRFDLHKEKKRRCRDQIQCSDLHGQNGELVEGGRVQSPPACKTPSLPSLNYWPAPTVL